MHHHTVEEMLAKIDAAIGPPDQETPEEHAQRVAMVKRRAEARVIRKAG